MNTKELLKWKWAYQEQLNILDANDAYWIDCAKHKWSGMDRKNEFGKFLTSYSLRRGKIAKYFSDENNLAYFITRCNEVFSPSLACDKWNEAQLRWDQINSEFKQQIGSTPASATLKSFWFYHPTYLPIYDQYTRDALKEVMKCKVTIHNYLSVFKDFHENKALEYIDAAEKQSDRVYISKPRVSDKYLWLSGSKNQKSILRNFQHGMQISPNNF